MAKKKEVKTKKYRKVFEDGSVKYLAHKPDISKKRADQRATFDFFTPRMVESEWEKRTGKKARFNEKRYAKTMPDGTIKYLKHKPDGKPRKKR